MDHLKSIIRDVPDFPTRGILFRDITPLLQRGEVFREIIDTFKARYEDKDIQKIAAVESRGFVFAAPLAYALRAGLVPLRKPGKLPYQTIQESYSLEYGQAALEVHTDAIDPGERVLVFDDLLATGGTASAAIELVRKLGGEVVEAGFVVELRSLKGREKLTGVPVFSLVCYD
jgi:adenine phosphoribosyltransferase